MKVILMHGKDTDPAQKWYPWFIAACSERGYEVEAPALPSPENPVLQEWVSVIDTLAPDKSTVLVGHSRGGVAILRWLEQQTPNTRIAKCVLVATNSGKTANMDFPEESNFGFYTEEGFDFMAIREHCDSFTVLHSKDDRWVSFAAGQENAEGLGAQLITFENLGHFGRGVDEIPKLLELITD